MHFELVRAGSSVTEKYSQKDCVILFFKTGLNSENTDSQSLTMVKHHLVPRDPACDALTPLIH